MTYKIFYRIETVYKSGRPEITCKECPREAEKLKRKYEAMPTVNSVTITEVRGRG